MNDSNGQRLSFLGIFKDKGYSVEIPIIQRDYAQGRDSTSRVRENFLSSLQRSLANDEPLDLDFIYGSISDGKLIPLDGQQRLTTLFLLHWYLASKEGYSESFNTIIRTENKSKFSYETRITSREFCNALVTNEILVPSSANTNMSNVIRDAQWFYISWEKDPTIKSMLTMLDAIHMKFWNSSNYFEKLSRTDNPLISFQFIELKDFGLSDSLYIKMNARGKELTSFENFKAKFEKLLEIHDIENSSNLKEEFSLKIDAVWPDIFWKFRDINTNSYDDKIMNFIRILATNDYVINTESTNYIHLDKLINAMMIDFDDFSELGCFTASLFHAVITTLNTLRNEGTIGIKEYLPDDLLLSESQLFQKAINYNLPYPDRIELHALYSYLNEYGNNEKLGEWIRIVRNLTENTRIDEIPDYVAALKSVNQLLPYANEILQYISEPSHEIKGFVAIQVAEERIKALLILKSEDWKQEITKVENHGYFKGQIGFLLKFSGITDYYKNNGNLNWSVDSDKSFFGKFLEYSSKAEAVFVNSGLRKFDDFLFERALLTKGNYLLSKGMNDSFLVDSDRDIGWKRLLRDDYNRRNYVEELFDSISTSRIEEDLHAMINSSVVTDWRRYFIEYPEMIGACGTNRFIRWTSPNDILLLERTQTNGLHREYYSYALCIKLKRMGNTVRYHDSNSVEYLKNISNINDQDIEISCDWSTGQYVVKYKDINIHYDSQDEVLTFLATQKII